MSINVYVERWEIMRDILVVQKDLVSTSGSP